MISEPKTEMPVDRRTLPRDNAAQNHLDWDANKVALANLAASDAYTLGWLDALALANGGGSDRRDIKSNLRGHMGDLLGLLLAREPTDGEIARACHGAAPPAELATKLVQKGIGNGGHKRVISRAIKGAGHGQ